jgi:hypothetical protein
VRPLVEKGEGLQMWVVTAKILNKQSRTAGKARSTSLAGGGGGTNNSSPENSSMLQNLHRALGLDGLNNLTATQMAVCCEHGNEYSGSLKV